MRKLIPIMLLALMAVIGVAGYGLLRAPDAVSGPVASIPLQVDQNALPAGTAPTRFQIDASRSVARFIVNEVLRGQPKTVVGETNQLAGELAVDPTRPATAQVGTIVVNARALETDDNQRNGAIRRWILDTDDYELIRFEPTELVGVPETASLGQPASFEIVGQLTIKDQTRPARFEAQVTPLSGAELQGAAATTIAYADWGIAIPDVPFVAGVEDTIRIELRFTAVAA